MKKVLYTAISAIGISAAACVSCDTIDEADRFVKEETVTPWDFKVTVDTITLGDETWEVQRVHRLLIEDFTGFMCTNCPNMADFIELDVIEKIDSLGVVVGMHMKGNSLSETSSSLSFQLSTDEARTYGEMLSGGVSSANISLPAVAVDRAQSSDSKLYVGVSESNKATVSNLAQNQYSRYNTTINAAAPNVDLAINVEADATASLYTLSTLVLSDVPTTLPLKLQLWVIEDGITGIQQTPTGVAIYQHNHVFRSSINGTWGEEIALDETLCATKSNSLTVASGWKAENCSVVGFVYRDDTKEVLNTVKVKLQ